MSVSQVCRSASFQHAHQENFSPQQQLADKVVSGVTPHLPNEGTPSAIQAEIIKPVLIEQQHAYVLIAGALFKNLVTGKITEGKPRLVPTYVCAGTYFFLERSALQSFIPNGPAYNKHLNEIGSFQKQSEQKMEDQQSKVEISKFQEELLTLFKPVE